MKSKAILTRKDVVVTLGCVIFLLATIGAVGGSGRKRAKQMVCLSNLRNWGEAFRMFAEDNAGYFMEGRHPEVSEAHNWWRALEPYYKERNLLRCPEASNKDLKGWVGMYSGNHGVWGPDWFPPEPPNGDGPWWGSYGVNEWVDNPSPHPSVYHPEKYWRTPYAAGSETIPVLLDAYWDQGWAEVFDWVPDWPGQWEGIGMDDMGHFMIVRHPAGDNCVLFMDYSARIVSIRDVWSLRWHRGYPTDPNMLPAQLNDPTHWINNLSQYD